MHRCIVTLVVATSLLASRASGKENDRKVLLKPETCKELTQTQAEKLPPSWKKYGRFVKACSIFASSAQEIKVISVWIQDYFDSKYPKDVAPAMEDFPRPVIVDQAFNVVGTLPEYYPDDPPRELDLYYLPKHESPPDLYVKVHNPGAGGDYSYPPMKWNLRNKSYIK